MFLIPLNSQLWLLSSVAMMSSHPSSLAAHRQKVWDSPWIQATYFSLLDALPDLHARARLLAVATKESGAWLNALPLSSVSLRMDDKVIRIAVSLRLGVSLCVPHQCHHCGAEVDYLGTRGLAVITARAATHAMRPLTT